MYESDGSRGRYTGLPFRAAEISTSGISTPTSTTTFGSGPASVFHDPKQVAGTTYDYEIEPPSYYISETTGHYISLTIGSKVTYLPIELYLNRYGMSKMNDWDGNSIKVSNDGGYILAPQVGAGHKENDNSFTGITIGEVF